jgi:hypothetical protein
VTFTRSNVCDKQKISGGDDDDVPTTHTYRYNYDRSDVVTVTGRVCLYVLCSKTNDENLESPAAQCTYVVVAIGVKNPPAVLDGCYRKCAQHGWLITPRRRETKTPWLCAVGYETNFWKFWRKLCIRRVLVVSNRILMMMDSANVFGPSFRRCEQMCFDIVRVCVANVFYFVFFRIFLKLYVIKFFSFVRKKNVTSSLSCNTNTENVSTEHFYMVFQNKKNQFSNLNHNTDV